MAETSTIEWTDATWNPITGCTLVSEGCRHCYAAQLAATRLKNHPTRAGLARLNAAGEAKFTGEVRLNEQWLDQPIRWNRPRRIFVCAHGDLFHEGVPDEWVDRVFAVMALAPQHTFQCLTKRPERAAAYLAMRDDRGRIPALDYAALMAATGRYNTPAVDLCAWPLPNVWLGTSVEDQATADERTPHLLAAPAAVRFLSAEPLLGMFRLDQLVAPHGLAEGQPWLNALSGYVWDNDGDSCPTGSRLDWVIVGGESGKHARPMHPDWARALRDQCQAAGVPFFFKQWGEWWPVSQMADGEMDGLYEPAPERHPDASRRCKHETVVLHQDGTLHSHMEPMAFRQGSGAMTVFQVGKKAAGRLLDGRTWDEMPATSDRSA